VGNERGQPGVAFGGCRDARGGVPLRRHRRGARKLPNTPRRRHRGRTATDPHHRPPPRHDLQRHRPVAREALRRACPLLLQPRSKPEGSGRLDPPRPLRVLHTGGCARALFHLQAHDLGIERRHRALSPGQAADRDAERAVPLYPRPATDPRAPGLPPLPNTERSTPPPRARSRSSKPTTASKRQANPTRRPGRRCSTPPSTTAARVPPTRSSQSQRRSPRRSRSTAAATSC
jgi:hypothetical protein